MIKQYIKTLIKNLPKTKLDKPEKIDIILEGGAFNGSYLIGALYFLKEMEKQNYIIIERISGCSVGSIAGLLYFMDSLYLVKPLYKFFLNCFKKNYNLSNINELKIFLQPYIDKDLLNKINNKLYINYNNIKKNKKYTKCNYKNIDELFDTIQKSCYIPYITDKNFLYKGKYMDGINPYIFKKRHNIKILFIDLYGFDKILNVLNTKNEKTNIHRILYGLLDIHTFYIKKTATFMCSYVHKWNIINKTIFSLRCFIEKIFVFYLYIILYFKNKFKNIQKNNLFFKIFKKILQDIYIILLKKYCL